MTMAVTYLLEVKSSITRRDIGIIKLNTSAGDPPSALTLLERFAAIHNQQALAARRGVFADACKDRAEFFGCGWLRDKRKRTARESVVAVLIER